MEEGNVLKNRLTLWAGILGAYGWMFLAVGGLPFVQRLFAREVLGPDGETCLVSSTAPFGMLWAVLLGLSFLCLSRCAALCLKRFARLGILACVVQTVGLVYPLIQEPQEMVAMPSASSLVLVISVLSVVANVLMVVALWALVGRLPRPMRPWGYAATVVYLVLSCLMPVLYCWEMPLCLVGLLQQVFTSLIVGWGVIFGLIAGKGLVVPSEP